MPANYQTTSFKLLLRSLVSLALGALFIAILNFNAPTTVGWRDSGEFILSPYFLDIPHPAGFPLYSQLANSFSLLLSGPIAWRTHSFTCLVSVALLFQLYFLAKTLSPGRLPFVPSATILTIVTLIASEAFYRSVSTAEVYGLSAVLLLGTFQCLVFFTQRTDSRFLFFAAFLGGLAVSNHVATSLYGLWVVIGLLVFKEIRIQQVIVAAVFVSIGLSTYAYLPVRSSHNPPLNTGVPHTLERFILHVTDARDRDLRAPSITPVTPPPKAAIIGNDLLRLSSELPWLLLPLCLVGIAGLARHNRKVLYYSIGIPVTTLGFFMGWDVDPWISALAIGTLYGSLGASCALDYCQRMKYPGAALARPLFITMCLIYTSSSLPNRYGMPADESAMQFAKTRLRTTTEETLLVADASWFITRYAQQIEGVAPNITTVYLPSLLFPHYFAPPHLTFGTEEWSPTDKGSPTDPNYSNLFSLISSASNYSKIEIEPNMNVSAPLREILRLDKDGVIRIEKGREGVREPGFIPSFISYVFSLLESSQRTQGVHHDDVDEHAKILLTQMMQTLKDLEEAELMIELCNSALFKLQSVKGYAKTESFVNTICNQKLAELNKQP